MPDPRHILRSIPLALLAVAIVMPPPAAAGERPVVGTDKMRAAEARLLKDINRIRVRHGRKPLRLDKRTSNVARARSSDMAAKRYFAHVEPDGDDAGRILDRRGIHAKEVTENIGHTIGLTLLGSSRRMARWWYRSRPHRVQMLARDINYVGLGVARRGRRITYTAIFTRARDKTRPRVVIEETSWQPSGGGSEVTVDWRGVDPRLATGRTGIRRYDVERLTRLGGWRRVDGDRRRSKRSFRTPATGEQRVRIRAIDRAGNVGPWSYARIEIPAGPVAPDLAARSGA